MRYCYLQKKISNIRCYTSLSSLTILLISLLFSLNIQAQSCTSTQFVKSYWFEGISLGCFLDRLPSGELYFGGSNDGHLILRKADINGNSIWDKQYKCIEKVDRSGFGFASIDSSGNYFINLDAIGIGLLDANGNVLTSALMKNNYSVYTYGSSIGVLADNKKILLIRYESTFNGDFSGNALICLSADLSTIIWTRRFSAYSCAFSGLNIFNNKIFVTGSVDNVATLLCFDAASGNLLSKNSYNSGYTSNVFYKTYKYNGGYLVQGKRISPTGRADHLILRLDDNLNVINSYILNDVWQNTSLKLAVEPDGSYHGAWGDELYMGTGLYSFSMSKEDSVEWSLFNGSISYRPNAFVNTPEGLTLLSYGFLTNIADPTRPKSFQMLSRTDASGKLLNCPSSDYPFTITNVVYSKAVSPITPKDTTFITLLPASIIVSDDVSEISESCRAVSTCDTISIIGNKDLCNVNTAQFIARRNKECFTPVTWAINNNSIVQTKLNDSTLSVQFSEPGTYTLIATLATCQSISDTIQINVTFSGQALELGPDTTICSGNTIVLNARKGFTSYLWQNGATDSIFKVTQPGLYHVRVTDACGGIYRDTIMVKAHPPIPFDAGPDRIKCNNDTIQLNATPGFLNYEWLPNYHINSTTSQKVIVNPLADINYTVKAEKTPGCFVYDTVHITVNRSMPVNLGPDTSFCFGDSVIFNAGNNFSSYRWSNNMTSQSITVKAAGSYSVDAMSEEGCHSFDTVKVISVFSKPIVKLDHNNNLCNGATRLLDAGKFTSYLWNDGSSGRTLLINKTGTYNVTVTDNNGCKASDTSFVISVLPLPTGFLPKDTSICSYGTLSLNAKPGFANYLWSNNSTSSSVTIDKPGIYWLQVTDDNSCTGKESIKISLKDCLQGFYIPNAFSPNSDGKNDVFKPMIFGNVTNYSFVIYNRFGQKIFESADLTRGWNGNVHGINQYSDIFVWTCSYQFAGALPEIKKGTVTLIR